jgi:tungstate transport system ATP-binding protein
VSVECQPLISLQRHGCALWPGAGPAGVDLQLRRGESLMLVGANGSGKTTLLRALHGLVPCSGTRVLHSGPDGREPVTAMVFQQPFMLNLSAAATSGWACGCAACRRGNVPPCAMSLRRVGLDQLADRPAPALSGGQQQRLALARAWGLRPDILFLDEPTASLDPSAKREVESLVQEFREAGVTLVMSTHNLGQAKRLGTRVAYLEAGRIVVDLPVDRFFNDELPTEAAQFLKGELPWR